MRLQVNTADEAKLCSPIHSPSDVLLVWYVVRRRGERPIRLTNAGYMHYSLQCISLICWAYFSDILVSTVFRKLLWIRDSADHQTVSMMFFGASLALESVLGWLCQSHHWVSHRLLQTVHFSSPITIWSRNKSVSLHRIRDDTSKRWFLLFPNCYFQFASNAKRP